MVVGSMDVKCPICNTYLKILQRGVVDEKKGCWAMCENEIRLIWIGDPE